MRRIILMIGLAVFSSGCSGYDTTAYNITTAGMLTVKGKNGEMLSEKDLIGKYCKIEGIPYNPLG